jgi:hypothetical protein
MTLSSGWLIRRGRAVGASWRAALGSGSAFLDGKAT